jgi:hypothetical protein
MFAREIQVQGGVYHNNRHRYCLITMLTAKLPLQGSTVDGSRGRRTISSSDGTGLQDNAQGVQSVGWQFGGAF